MDASLRGNPIAIFDRILFCHDLNIDTTMPAVVSEVYNDDTVLVEPLVKLVDKDDEREYQAIRVSIKKENHGGFFVNHPVMKGDTGWIVASVRDTSLVKKYNSSDHPDENEGAQTPNKNKNLHKFRFGFFIPDRWITLPKELTKSIEYKEAPDGSYFGGEFVIGSNRNAAGNFDISSKFGVVRDSEGNDVPYTKDIEGHTKAQKGDLTGKYFWSMLRLCSDGSFDAYGQGSRFSVREDGLYLDDDLIVNKKMGVKKYDIHDSNGETIGSVDFLADKNTAIGAGEGIEIALEDGVFKIKNNGVVGLEQGDNVTIEENPDRKGVFKISSTGGGGGGGSDEIEVVTSVEFRFDGVNLICQMRKAKIKATLVEEGITPNPDTVPTVPLNDID